MERRMKTNIENTKKMKWKEMSESEAEGAKGLGDRRLMCSTSLEKIIWEDIKYEDDLKCLIYLDVQILQLYTVLYKNLILSSLSSYRRRYWYWYFTDNETKAQRG